MKRATKILIIVFFVAYTLITLFPIYTLFIRTFVGTKHSTDLWLWPPPLEEASMDYQWGNLSVFYNLNVDKVKKDLGIPEDAYIQARWTLSRIATEYDIPEQKIKDYFTPYSVYSGWIILFSDAQFWPALFRTVVIAAFSLIGLNLLSIFTGFGLAGLRRKDQIVVFNLYLLSAVIPLMMILLPQYMIVQEVLKWIPGYEVSGSMTRRISQIVVIVLLHIKGGALGTMVYTSYISSIPKELEDAAEIDGATTFEYFRYIVLPLLKIPMATLTVMILPSLWNDFMGPYIYLDKNNTTLLPLIQSYTGTYTTNYQVTYTGIFVSIVPLVLIYIMFRKWFIRGAMSGAVKG
ncbi:MAG TPA: carbohydrate ABC transporter permease [Aggregatilinea sp.]|uniref:carbohydrate ABC transporter permease n=1 Tax=Aggregatilinea sp. TaxID=2806333 RepID=UPI002CC790BF|nr:carbohydrate ABC transporter permease [Aggregatilinea sp.]HML20894.1 carbohydrate ABC transporter permease [Aggregatilinea sp.]